MAARGMGARRDCLLVGLSVVEPGSLVGDVASLSCHLRKIFLSCGGVVANSVSSLKLMLDGLANRYAFRRPRLIVARNFLLLQLTIGQAADAAETASKAPASDTMAVIVRP